VPLSESDFRKEAKGAVQLYMIWVRGQEKDTCFIQGDGWFIMPPRQVKSPLVAFDLLFKFYHVINVQYPPYLHNFFNFLECYLYNINKTPVSTVSAMHVNISNYADAGEDEEDEDGLL